MCPFNLTGLKGTIDCPNTVEDKFSKIFENNTIFDIYIIYRDKLDENENKYYYVLFVRVPLVVMVTVVVKNEVEIQFEIQIEMIEIEIQYRKPITNPNLKLNCNENCHPN